MTFRYVALVRFSLGAWKLTPAMLMLFSLPEREFTSSTAKSLLLKFALTDALDENIELEPKTTTCEVLSSVPWYLILSPMAARP